MKISFNTEKKIDWVSTFEPLPIAELTKRFFYGVEAEAPPNRVPKRKVAPYVERDLLVEDAFRSVEVTFYGVELLKDEKKGIPCVVSPFLTRSLKLRRAWSDRNARAPVDYVLRTFRPPASIGVEEVELMLEASVVPSKAIFNRVSEGCERLIQLVAKQIDAYKLTSYFVKKGFSTQLLRLFHRISNLSGDVVDVNLLRHACSSGFDVKGAHQKLDRCGLIACPLCGICAGSAFNGVFKVGKDYYAVAYVIGGKDLHITTSEDWVPVSLKVTGELLDVGHAFSIRSSC